MNSKKNLFLYALLTILLGSCFIAKAEAGDSSFNIAIFKEENFPAIGVPSLLTPEWMHEKLCEKFTVAYLNMNEIINENCFNAGKFDLLILPYGEAFPYQAYPAIKKYIQDGGGFFNLAGVPFRQPVDFVENKWQEVDNKGFYMRFLAPLGIKYYEVLDENRAGLTVATSFKRSPIVPSFGNVFPYRVPARDFFNFYIINKNKDNKSVVFVKSWGNPYKGYGYGMQLKKWVMIGQRQEAHPLNPFSKNAANNLFDIMEQLTFPVVLHDLESDFPVYKNGEKVKISAKIFNSGEKAMVSNLEFEIRDKNGKVVFRRKERTQIGGGQTFIWQTSWAPKRFRKDFYSLHLLLKKRSKILDKAENGFLATNERLSKKSPSVSIQDKKFYINGKKSFIFGTNYYESKTGELMWVKPNILKIKNDFEAMGTMGINFVRIHYHHSKWFRDYFAEVLKEELDPYLQIADTSVFPSERSLRILDAIIYLANSNNMVFCMDVLSLVPVEMGNPIGWLGLKERVEDPKKVNIQKKFIKILAQRYRDIPGIIWDLWNEPRLPDTDMWALKYWASKLKETFRGNGDTHLITIGGLTNPVVLDVLDYASVHTDNIIGMENLSQLSKPFIFGEVWNDAECGNDNEAMQAKKMDTDLSQFLKTSALGFVPWQWTRQGRLWDDISEPEKWDDELGCCVREDGSLKPAAQVYSLFINRIKRKNNE